jgi:hypothetical protein
MTKVTDALQANLNADYRLYRKYFGAHEKARERSRVAGFNLVAGIGFEPMTFRL